MLSKPGCLLRLVPLLGAAATVGIGAVAEAAVLARAEVPLVGGARASELGRELRIRGIPTRIRIFAVDKEMAAVLAHYRDALGRERIEADVDGWKVLSRRAGRVLQTVRLRAAGGGATEGTLSESDLEAAPGRGAGTADFPLPVDSRLSADLEMSDRGRHARLLAWANNHGAEANAQHLRARLAERGYQQERTLPVNAHGLRGRSLWFAGDGCEAVAVIVEKAGAVSVTLNLVRKREEGVR